MFDPFILGEVMEGQSSKVTDGQTGGWTVILSLYLYRCEPSSTLIQTVCVNYVWGRWGASG